MNDIELLEALELWHKQVTDARTNYLLLMGEEHEETALHEATLLAAIKFMHRTHSEIEALQAENKQLQSELTIAIQNHDHAKEVLERLQIITNRATDRAMKVYAELHDAKAKNEALQMDNQQLQSDIVNANMNADHAMAENERLRKIAGAMHTWIFLHTGDEEKAYKECGLTDEDNAMPGYIGKIELEEQEDATE